MKNETRPIVIYHSLVAAGKVAEERLSLLREVVMAGREEKPICPTCGGTGHAE